jgi:hypothetical protein
MSDPHSDSHAPIEEEPETPFWLPALGFALFVFGGIGWAVSPSLPSGTPGPLPPPPTATAAAPAASPAPAPTPPPQALPPTPVGSVAAAPSAAPAPGGNAKGGAKKVPPPPGAHPKKAKPLAPANP